MLGDFVLPRFLLSGITFFSGLVFIYAGIVFKNRIRFFFAATFHILAGLLFFIIIDINFLYFSLPMIWPVLMLFIAMSFLLSGFLRWHKMQTVNTVIGLAFSVLGVIFLLFSTKIITISFKSIALWWFPLFSLPYISVFIIWFFKRHAHVRESDE